MQKRIVNLSSYLIGSDENFGSCRWENIPVVCWLQAFSALGCSLLTNSNPCNQYSTESPVHVAY